MIEHSFDNYTYWAPEYRTEGLLSPAADVYCLGLMMVELYTWRTVFDRDGAQRVARFCSSAEDRAKMAIGSWSPEDRVCFADLAARCLEPEREARPTAAECVIELMRVATTLGTPERPALKRARTSAGS